MNVPFDLPVAAFGRGEDFKVLGAGAGGGGLVLFRPREWRGNSSSTVPFSGPEQHQHRPGQDLQVQHRRPRHQVLQVVTQLVGRIGVVTGPHLG